MKVKITGPIFMVVCYVTLKGMYKEHLRGSLVSRGSICMVKRLAMSNCKAAFYPQVTGEIQEEGRF